MSGANVNMIFCAGNIDNNQEFDGRSYWSMVVESGNVDWAGVLFAKYGADVDWSPDECDGLAPDEYDYHT
eukprot:SAG11_NODE_21445_length_425_cov_0.598160_1_plen_69_part_10